MDCACALLATAFSGRDSLHSMARNIAAPCLAVGRSRRQDKKRNARGRRRHGGCRRRPSSQITKACRTAWRRCCPFGGLAVAGAWCRAAPLAPCRTALLLFAARPKKRGPRHPRRGYGAGGGPALRACGPVSGGPPALRSGSPPFASPLPPSAPPARPAVPLFLPSPGSGADAGHKARPLPRTGTNARR